eukprot:TRINITY_DN7993_c0_g1_i2.p1 TRINITY_DN7993_c0_g1~~TRINITY_DN7993_c0_g1_i2.p1  ORF type:complete len:453 (-),score=111.92 TRINITY_DN7993_c0_g1_i2:71-1429(-)
MKTTPGLIRWVRDHKSGEAYVKWGNSFYLNPTRGDARKIRWASLKRRGRDFYWEKVDDSASEEVEDDSVSEEEARNVEEDHLEVDEWGFQLAMEQVREATSIEDARAVLQALLHSRPSKEFLKAGSWSQALCGLEAISCKSAEGIRHAGAPTAEAAVAVNEKASKPKILCTSASMISATKVETCEEGDIANTEGADRAEKGSCSDKNLKDLATKITELWSEKHRQRESRRAAAAEKKKSLGLRSISGASQKEGLRISVEAVTADAKEVGQVQQAASSQQVGQPNEKGKVQEIPSSPVLDDGKNDHPTSPEISGGTTDDSKVQTLEKSDEASTKSKGFLGALLQKARKRITVSAGSTDKATSDVDKDTRSPKAKISSKSSKNPAASSSSPSAQAAKSRTHSPPVVPVPAPPPLHLPPSWAAGPPGNWWQGHPGPLPANHPWTPPHAQDSRWRP